MTNGFEWIDCPSCTAHLCKNYHQEFEIEIGCRACGAIHLFTKKDGVIKSKLIRESRKDRHKPTRFT